MEIFIFRRCSQVIASGVEMSTAADTLPVCSILGYLIEWSFSENGQSTYAEMHFENSKKSIYPIIMEISIFRPCLQVMKSGIDMSTEADIVPVCSILLDLN